MATPGRRARGPAAFEFLVKEALVDFETRFQASLTDQTALPKLSINDFAKYYRFSRSTLYKRHQDLVPKISDLFASLSSKVNLPGEPHKAESVKTLREEISKLKKQHKRDLAVAYSVTMTEMIKEISLRDEARLISELRALKEENETLRKIDAKQREIIARYLSMVK